MITLWGRDNSTNVKKVLWLLDELKLPFQQINAGGAYGKNHEPLYLSLNPNGLVPCIQDDDFACGNRMPFCVISPNAQAMKRSGLPICGLAPARINGWTGPQTA